MSILYIPETIKAGFQNRKDTYSGKLAYVIALGKDKKWRKENSWNGWRSKEIEPSEHANDPTEGFVLNKKVGDYKSDWNHRQAYSRVYDPRGWEFEIDVDNLLFILENCSSMPGKALGGEFVYAWSGKDLVLLPTNAQDYKEQFDFSRLKEVNIGVRALQEGYSYTDRKNKKHVYIGRYEAKENVVYPLFKAFVFWSNDGGFEIEKKLPKFIQKSEGPVDNIDSLRYDFINSHHVSKVVGFRMGKKEIPEHSDYWGNIRKEKIKIDNDTAIVEKFDLKHIKNGSHVCIDQYIYTLKNGGVISSYKSSSNYYWRRDYTYDLGSISPEEFSMLDQELYAVLDSGKEKRL